MRHDTTFSSFLVKNRVKMHENIVKMHENGVKMHDNGVSSQKRSSELRF